MLFSLQQIQGTMKSLVQEGLAGWRPEKRADYLDAGTIVNDRYRVEGPLRIDGSHSLNRVSLTRGGDICQSCRLREDQTQNPFCRDCSVKLREKIFQMEVVPGQMDTGLIEKLLDISHPGIPRIHDIFTTGSNTYLVSEYLRGPRLDCWEGVLTAQEFQMVGISLAQTVEFLHNQGIFHMDLRPHNLKLVEERPWLISIGASKLRTNPSQRDFERLGQEDLMGLLETLEGLAAEYVDNRHDEMLWRLVVALEELIGKDELNAREIKRTLASS